MQPADVARLDRGGHVLLALPAGSIHVHHRRPVHWSAPATSPGERRLLIKSYSAADAVSLVPDTTGSALAGTIVRGRPARAGRHDAGTMPLPPGFLGGYTSIDELQASARGAMSRRGHRWGTRARTPRPDGARPCGRRPAERGERDRG
jgi:hypothetical protein